MKKKHLFSVSLISFLTTGPSVVFSEQKNSKTDLSEYGQALTLKPDIKNGRDLYKACVACHGPEGWGNKNGSYPQIAGQLSGVTIKQLADIRSGNRDNPIMRAFTTARALGGAQEIADIAGYIASLPMTANNGRGTEMDLALGKEIYLRDCADCHGDSGEGKVKNHTPRLQGQHYQYLTRQYRWIRNGRRRNANKEMVEQIQNYRPKEERAVLTYAATLEPPEKDLAKPGWRNPDFPNHFRNWTPKPPGKRMRLQKHN